MQSLKPMRIPGRHAGSALRRLRPFWFLCALFLILAGCHLRGEDEIENTISFDRMADSLKQFDEVVIVLETLDGDTIDVVYRGKVDEAADVIRLKAPNWDGGKVVVSITGTKDGEVAYQVETRFDPATDTRDNVAVFVTPDVTLSSTVGDLTLLLGDSLPHIPVSVKPAHILDKTLEWEANPPGLLVIGPGLLIAERTGNGMLTGSLRAKPSVKISIPFTIAVSGLVPESLSIEPESLEIAAGGAPGFFTAAVFPSAASSAVLWTSEDTSIAAVDRNGRVQGKRQGRTSVKAVSRTRPSVAAYAQIIVSGPVPVEKVSFVFASQDIPVGAAETLLVIVTPPGANPAVSFSLSDPSKAGVENGKITGKAVGTLSVVAASVSNPEAKDTLIVNVKMAIATDTTAPGKPTVTITLPQASGTFITAADTVRVSGTSSGPNGMAAVEYTLDGGAAKALTLGAGGSWTIPSLSIPNAKTSILKVIVTDSGGNKGEAQISVLRDSDPPSPPVSLSDPASPTNVATASWTWAAGDDGETGSGLSGKYRWKVNTGAWTEVATAAATGVTLSPGSNLFSVQEQDKAGNWSAAATDTVVLDNRAPDAVTFIGIDSGYTDDATPTWTWAPSTANGGIAEYVLKLDAGAEFTWAAAAYTPTTLLSDNAVHTLTVRQKDQVPGVVGAANSFSYRIKVNPPAAPTVKSAVAALANNGLTRNPGFTWTTGGGGNGKFRVKVNAETAYRVNGVAGTTYSLPAGDADGIYKVSVSEQDDLGRYGPEGSFTIRLDRTPPKFANAKIAGKPFPLRDGFITNDSTLAITYTSDSMAKSFNCILTDNAVTTCKGATQTDSAGNSAAFQTNIWRRSKVVFFTPKGTGDGSSWEEAAGDIQAQVDAGGDGKDFWLASGDYTDKNNSLTIWGITLNLLGGFFADSYPTDTQDRNKGGSILAHISTMGTYGTWDGLQFVAASNGFRLALAMGSTDKPATFIDCQFKAGFSIVLGGAINFQNCQMIGVRNQTTPLLVSGNSVITWEGGAIKDNISSNSSERAISIQDGSMTFKGNLTISGNSPTFSTTQIYNDGELIITPSVTFSCADIENGPNASGTCKGTDIQPGL